MFWPYVSDAGDKLVQKIGLLAKDVELRDELLHDWRNSEYFLKWNEDHVFEIVQNRSDTLEYLLNSLFVYYWNFIAKQAVLRSKIVCSYLLEICISDISGELFCFLSKFCIPDILVYELLLVFSDL